MSPTPGGLAGWRLAQRVAGGAGEDTAEAEGVPAHPALRGLSIIGRTVLFGT